MNYKEYGNWFGYPLCCTEYFSNDVLSEDQYKAANETGFVPCPEHTRQILNGEITLESIIKDRKCPIPFPGIIPKKETRYTKIFLHPSWTKKYKNECFREKIRGNKLNFHQRSRRSIN